MPQTSQHSFGQIIDVLILGGGLAGCVLAWQLHQQGKTIMILDEPTISRASRVGAGIINPITGKRYSSMWNAQETIPSAIRFYQGLESFFNEPLLRGMPTLRLFANEEERNFWLEKRAPTQDFTRLLGAEEILQDILKTSVSIPNTAGGLEYTSWHVETERVIELLTTFFARNGELLQEIFDEKEIKISAHGVQYKNIQADSIVFCNGWKAHQSFFWSNIWAKSPLSPAKGELLTVRLEGAFLQHLLVQGVFVLPLRNGTARIGATYEWDDLTENTTEAAQNLIFQEAQALFPANITVLEHHAGIRPAARDSKPFLGQHPVYDRAFMMNGFGAKGAAYAPYCAERIITCLQGNTTAVPQEISLRRFLPAL